jgi:protein RecA
MERTKPKPSEQLKSHSKSFKNEKKEYDGNTETMISTGSTLLDLAISGGRIRGGGIPGGILVEIFGPSASGKTVLLCEIAGAIQRAGGDIKFHDPESRLNKQFARLFDLDVDALTYDTPDTVPEVFDTAINWDGGNNKKINGILADSLAALSTDLEMDNDDGDKMGMRRAKEFSEACRKACRKLTKHNILMVCSNQVRQNVNAGPYAAKYRTPGGEAVGFYASLRLRMNNPQKIKKKMKIKKKEVTRVVGIETEIEVFKSSVWKPYQVAPIIILFDYGIDDIRANLQFVKNATGSTTYTCQGEMLGKSMGEAIEEVEERNLIHDLKEEVIDLWEEIEGKFVQKRKPKRR